MTKTTHHRKKSAAAKKRVRAKKTSTPKRTRKTGTAKHHVTKVHHVRAKHAAKAKAPRVQHAKKAKAPKAHHARKAATHATHTRKAASGSKKLRIHLGKKGGKAKTASRTTGGHHALGGATVGGAVAGVPLDQIVQQVESALLSGGFVANIITAIAQVIDGSQSSAAGRLVAGTIATATGALLLNGSSVPIAAMVFLNGAATATSCYVPTHLRASVAAGDEVWVIPINGSFADLQLFSIRNVF